MLEVLRYVAKDGRQPFTEWYRRLDMHAAARVGLAVVRMSEGNLANTKSVGAGVMERRIDWGPGYRIYFGREGDRVVVLGGGTKQRQQVDIERAHARWADYKQRR